MEHRFERVKTVNAASGVKIVAPNLECALPGSQVRVVKEDALLERVMDDVKTDIEKLKMETTPEGILIRADTMGSLEALALELKEQGIEAIKRADVGNISKRDVIESTTVKNPYFRVILGFNVSMLPDAKEAAAQAEIPVFVSDVIYRLIEDYEEWVTSEREKEKRELMERVNTPAKIKLLPGCVFRQSKPAIVGVEVLAGKIKTGVDLIKTDGANIGPIKEIQDKGENLSRAEQGMQVAIALRKPTVGRHINENDVLYVNLNEDEIVELKKRRGMLSPDEEEVLEELEEIKRKRPFREE